MLLLGHAGYTVGAAWAVEARSRRQGSMDYRAVVLMAFAPDIIDRLLFVFALADAASGRLVAHTLLFEIGLIVALGAVRRSWWIYGAASAFHLVLDSVDPSWAWAKHVLWPFLGRGWEAIGLAGGTGREAGPYSEQISTRIQMILGAYHGVPWWIWLLELGGVLVLVLFAYRKGLLRGARLRRFLATGSAQSR